jgi:hypothetical protein
MYKSWKGAVVLHIVAVLFLSGIVTAETVKNRHEIKMDNSCLMTTNPNPSVPFIESAVDPVIFSQSPSTVNDSYFNFTSASNLGSICADDFWDLTEMIWDIHWWGFCMYWDGSGWTTCDPTGMLFDVIFYDVNMDPFATYGIISPAEPTGVFYNGFELLYWEGDFAAGCSLTEGWVSIQSVYSPNDCSFLWINSQVGNWNAMQNWIPINPPDNLAFELTGESNPSIDVEKYVWDEKNQKWVDADTENTALDIPICNNVTFMIDIYNDGDCTLSDIYVYDVMHDSLKFISANPEPDESFYDPPYYFINWFFDEPLRPCESINIYITAHVEGPECSTDFNSVNVSGECNHGIVLDSDIAYVHAVKKNREFNIPFLNWLQSHPNMFPILQLLIQKLGLQ